MTRPALSEAEIRRRIYAQYKEKCAEVVQLRRELAQARGEAGALRVTVAAHREIVDLAERALGISPADGG